MVDFRTSLASGSGGQAAKLPTVGHSEGKGEFWVPSTQLLLRWHSGTSFEQTTVSLPVWPCWTLFNKCFQQSSLYLILRVVLRGPVGVASLSIRQPSAACRQCECFYPECSAALVRSEVLRHFPEPPSCRSSCNSLSREWICPTLGGILKKGRLQKLDFCF